MLVKIDIQECGRSKRFTTFWTFCGVRFTSKSLSGLYCALATLHARLLPASSPDTRYARLCCTTSSDLNVISRLCVAMKSHTLKRLFPTIVAFLEHLFINHFEDDARLQQIFIIIAKLSMKKLYYCTLITENIPKVSLIWLVNMAIIGIVN